MHHFALTIFIIIFCQPICFTETTTNTFEVTRGIEDSFQFLENRGLDCETTKTNDDGTKTCLCVGIEEKQTMIFDNGRKVTARCEMNREIMENFKHKITEGKS